MHCKLLKRKGSWNDVKNAAMTTINKTETDQEPSSNWKRKILLAEHSPIRHLIFSAKWYNLPYWVSVHLTRHKIGTEHFVRTQRSDRTGIDRNILFQGAVVEHEILINAQAIINISKKRLCTQSSKETREAWKALLIEIKKAEPELASLCVKECIYRGFCSEFNTCGFAGLEEHKIQLEKYRNGDE